MAIRAYPVLFLLYSLIVSTSALDPGREAPGARSTPAANKFFFAFGDSYTSMNFNATGEQPYIGNPIGNPIFPGNTACGRVNNWVDWAIATLNSTYIATYDFAYGGATIDANLVTPYLPTVKSLIDQVNDFGNYTAYGRPYYPGYTPDNSVWAFWFGINDIGNSWYQPGDRDAFSDLLLTRYFEQVDKVYNSGARNFLFLNVPPIYSTPLGLAQPESSRETIKVILDGFNKKLAIKVKAFGDSHPGARTWLYDTDALLKKVLANPYAYGLKDNTTQGSGNDVAWCNNYHISPPVHFEVARGVKQLLPAQLL